jgi:hypothetical protein
MDDAKCPHPYGSIEYDNWWHELHDQLLKGELRRLDEYNREVRERQWRYHYHDFVPATNRCMNCGIGLHEYMSQDADYRLNPLRQPICTGPLSDPE